MNKTPKTSSDQDAKDITLLLTDEDSETGLKKRDSSSLGRTLDGQMGYFIDGQVQTPDGQSHQGYRA